MQTGTILSDYPSLDVVYVVKPGDRNHELLYSLRSLSRLRHNTVWTVGYTPKWANTHPIRTNQVGNKYINVFRNFTAIVNNPDITERFVLFNDDFFVMRACVDVPTYHRGSLTGHIARRNPGGYTQLMVFAHEILSVWGVPEPYLSYTSHCPVIVEKAKLGELVDRVSRTTIPGNGGMLYRTLYGNLFGIGGEEAPDFKVSGNGRPALDAVLNRHFAIDDRGPLFLSTEDVAFSYGEVGKYIRERFPDPSPYEDNERFRRLTRLH